MRIAGPESHSPGKKDQTDEFTPARDPIDELVALLREEFKRGLLREKAQKQATARRRTIALIVGLLILAAMTVAAVVFRNSLHLPS